MKKTATIGLIIVSFFIKAQEVSVEKNLNSLQLGLFSLSYQNERGFDRKLTLKSEIGLSPSFAEVIYSDGNKEKSFLIFPYLNLEPRWYYSLDRRSRLKKNTKNNSSNYISLLASFASTRTELLNTKKFEVAPFIKIVPEFGIRRTSKSGHFFSEYSIGYGYQHNFFDRSYNYTYDKNQGIIDIQYKIGLIF